MANPSKLENLKGAHGVAALGRVLALIVLMLWPGMLEHGFSADFRAGAAKAMITPNELGWLGGYGHRNRPAEGAAADLWTRALALEDKLGHRRVLVSTDIHIFTREQHREIAEAVRKRHRIEERDLMLIATHTHSGPALPRGFDPGISWGLNEEEMRKLHAASDRVRDQTLDAIGRALSDLQPARLSFGRGKATFGVNRRVPKDNGSYDFGSNPAGVSDPDVPVLLIESTKGAPRAVVFTYACHCTSIRNGRKASTNIIRTMRVSLLRRLRVSFPGQRRSTPPVAPGTSIRSRREE